MRAFLCKIISRRKIRLTPVTIMSHTREARRESCFASDKQRPLGDGDKVRRNPFPETERQTFPLHPNTPMNTEIQPYVDLAADFHRELAGRYAHDASTHYLTQLVAHKSGSIYLNVSLHAEGEQFIERDENGVVIKTCPCVVKSISMRERETMSHNGIVVLTTKHLVREYETARANWLGTNIEEVA